MGKPGSCHAWPSATGIRYTAGQYQDWGRTMSKGFGRAAAAVGGCLLASVVATSGRQDPPQYTSPSGRAYHAQPDTNGAVAKARARVEAEAGSVDALMALGDAWAAVWNHREAIAVYDRVLAGRDRHALALQQRGHRRLSIRQFDLARADLERAVALDASLVDAYYYLGLLDYLDGRYDRAAAHYARNLALKGDDVVKGIAAIDWLYLSYRRAGQHESARALAARVTPDLPIEGSSRLYFNRLRFYQGQLREADLPRENLSDIEVTTLAYGVGVFKLVEGDRAGARAQFERAVSTSAWPALAFIAAEHELSIWR